MVSALGSGSGGLGLCAGRDTALCSWTRHFTLTVPLYPGVLMGTVELSVGGNPAMD